MRSARELRRGHRCRPRPASADDACQRRASVVAADKDHRRLLLAHCDSASAWVGTLAARPGRWRSVRRGSTRFAQGAVASAGNGHEPTSRVRDLAAEPGVRVFGGVQLPAAWETAQRRVARSIARTVHRGRPRREMHEKSLSVVPHPQAMGGVALLVKDPRRSAFAVSHEGSPARLGGLRGHSQRGGSGANRSITLPSGSLTCAYRWPQ